uniref:Chorismate lyase n=1 Tax=Inkyuleea mariana TaxID=123988 RepID=A0A4D6X2K3_9FLOR|nr:hypothetical protein [Inkyuleea mariana]
MHIYTFHKFHSILILPINNLKDSYNRLTDLIPIEWQIILMSDGSFTQNLNSLTGKCTKIKIFQKYNDILINQIKNIRVVWLKNDKFDQLTFARSLWRYTCTDSITLKLSKQKAVGQSIIESKIDIYKDIHEIYYGYCIYLEKKFNSKKPIWGRKYTLYYNHQSYAVIQEFFSPNLINFF